MGIMPDTSPYGGQTVTGPGWPNVDEDALAAAAMSYEKLVTQLTGSVVPQHQGQMMQLSNSWEGTGAVAAVGEASTIISGHEANAAHAAAIAAKLRSMEASVVKAKVAANAVAVETQRECEALAAAPFPNAQELLQSRVMLGLSQNISQVTGSSTELANTLGVAPVIPPTGVPTGTPGQEAAQEGGQQAAEMVSQMVGMATQIPMQIGQLVGQIPQQMAEPLQQLTQPLQQMTSMFGGLGGGSGAGGLGPSPFSAFSNHPLAGGSGAGGGSGMVRAASLPGSGGSAVQTPLMANLVGKTSPVAVDNGAAVGAAVAGGVAPVAAGMGGGMGGGMGMAPGMMGTRGTSGGSRPGIAAPEVLEHDLAVDDEDDW